MSPDSRIGVKRPLPARIAAHLLTALLVGACVSPGFAKSDDPAEAEPVAASGHALSVEARFRIPVREVSGLALVPGDTMDIYAVGDSSYEIGRVTIQMPSGSTRIDKVDATHLFSGHETEASQWEAVAADGRGRLCVQAEVSAHVSCFSDDLQTLSGSFDLDPSSIKSLAKLWEKEPNSRGEGMILMKRGHLLLLKEKKPSLLVEFGPKDEPPMGYGQDTFLAPGEAFARPVQDRLVALNVWEFSNSLESLAKDASDITVGPDGRVYLLSDESAIVIRLEGHLKPEEAKVHDSASWKLPAEIVKPEGLVVDKEMRPWVAVDSKEKDQPNLFRLMRIESP